MRIKSGACRATLAAHFHRLHSLRDRPAGAAEVKDALSKKPVTKAILANTAATFDSQIMTTAELRRAPNMTFNFDGQYPRKMDGSSRQNFGVTVSSSGLPIGGEGFSAA